jgi:hypothetical protein
MSLLLEEERGESGETEICGGGRGGKRGCMIRRVWSRRLPVQAFVDDTDDC